MQLVIDQSTERLADIILKLLVRPPSHFLSKTIASRWRWKVWPLFPQVHLAGAGKFGPEPATQALAGFLETLEDLAIDVPKAPKLLGMLVAGLITEKVSNP